LTPSEILTHLKALVPSAEVGLDETQPEPMLLVARAHLTTVAKALRGDEALAFDCLMCLSGADRGTELQVVTHLYSMKHAHHVALRCVISKDDALAPSVSSVWPAAEWHEREAFDLLGIHFSAHPDLRRILCPDDWEGHPLRKDYVAQTEYHGIPLTSSPTGEPAS